MPSRLFPSPAPSLPSFSSLLVKGPYPPSAPIHLCTSHLQDNAGKVLFLSPSRQSLAIALQDFNDEWLTTNAAKGQYMALLSRIDIYYPPNTAHWLLLLSLFKPLSSSSTPLNKSVLPRTPSLIVLHEPSSYFISAESSQSPPLELSQYLQLVTTAFSTSSFLSQGQDKPIRLVLFDSRLEQLKLPIVRPVTPSRQSLFGKRQESPTRQKNVETYIEKYFEWIGSVVDEHIDQSTSTTPGTPPRPGTFDTPLYERRGPFRLRLDKRVPSDDETDFHSNHLTFEWSEIKGDRQRFSTFRKTRLVFKEGA